MRAGVLALALLICPPAWGQIYKCVDARGVTHYSDKPRPECRSVETAIRGQEPISGKLDTYDGDHRDSERAFKERQEKRAAEQKELLQIGQKRRERCDRMRESYQQFMSMRRVPNPGPQGQRDYLDADARDAKAAEMAAIIARDCP